MNKLILGDNLEVIMNKLEFKEHTHLHTKPSYFIYDNLRFDDDGKNVFIGSVCVIQDEYQYACSQSGLILDSHRLREILNFIDSRQ